MLEEIEKNTLLSFFKLANDHKIAGFTDYHMELFEILADIEFNDHESYFSKKKEGLEKFYRKISYLFPYHREFVKGVKNRLSSLSDYYKKEIFKYKLARENESDINNDDFIKHGLQFRLEM